MLMNCAAYENGTKLSDIAVDGISDYLKRPGCFVWVALRDARALAVIVTACSLLYRGFKRSGWL